MLAPNVPEDTYTGENNKKLSAILEKTFESMDNEVLQWLEGKPFLRRTFPTARSCNAFPAVD